MISCFYLPMVAALTMPEPNSLPVNLMLEGSWGDALDALRTRTSADHGTRTSHTAWRLQVTADLLYARRVDADAEDAYRIAQAARRHERRHYRMYCLRNSGWQLLLRGRSGQALVFFVRLIKEANEHPDLCWEAEFGMALSLYELGDCDEALSIAEKIVESTNDAAPHSSPRRALADLLRFDLEVRHMLFKQSSMSRHLFRTVSLGGVALNDQQRIDAIALPQIGDSFALEARRDFLQALCALASGKSAAKRITDFPSIHWAQANWLPDLAASMRVDILLAAIAGGQRELTASVAKTLHTLEHDDHLLQRIDYLFALSELALGAGEPNQWLDLYQSYTVQVVSAIRAHSFGLAFYKSRVSDRRGAADDISSSLPARYRRAHAFILQNLSRKDLSIHEVASATGVTTRTLQNIFMKSLGQTPSAFIRQLRMNQIETELSDDAMLGHISETRLAKEWGIYAESAQFVRYRQARGMVNSK